MLNFRINLKGAEKLAFNLRNTPLRDWTAFWPIVGTYLAGIIASQFAEEGGASGRWAALSPNYLKRKQKKWPGQTILRASDRLWHALATEAGSGDTVDERWPTKFRWGTSLAYAGYAQTGFRTRLGTGKAAVSRQPSAVSRRGSTGLEPQALRSLLAFVPARKIFDFRPSDISALGRLALAFQAQEFRKRGFAIAKEAGVTVDVSQALVVGRTVYGEDLGLSL